jgi:hypothetical protein
LVVSEDRRDAIRRHTELARQGAGGQTERRGLKRDRRRASAGVRPTIGRSRAGGAHRVSGSGGETLPSAAGDWGV